MAEYAEIPDKVAQLSDLGAELVEEVEETTLLEDGKSCLDQRFNTSLSHLNRSSSQLPAAVDVLILEKPPVCRSFLTGSFPTLLKSLGLLDAPQGLRTARSTRHQRGLAADGRPGQASRQEVEDKSDCKFLPTCPLPQTRTDIATQLFWMTFLIPIVNVATTLHSLAAEASPRPLPLISLPPCLLTQPLTSRPENTTNSPNPTAQPPRPSQLNTPPRN